MSGEVDPETENEMRARFLEDVLIDLERQTEGWILAITPLGDSMGFRAEMQLVDENTGATLFLAGASAVSALAAGSMAVARGLSRLEEVLNQSDEEHIAGSADD